MSIPIAVAHEIQLERYAQDDRWGEQNHPPVYWIGILAEELGEAAKEAIEMLPAQPRDREQLRLNYRAELVQLAAVAIAAIGVIDRGY